MTHLYKIKPITGLAKDTNNIHVFEPGQSLCIDETMVKSKVRLSFKQHLPSKPKIKWEICDWEWRSGHAATLTLGTICNFQYIQDEKFKKNVKMKA